MRIQLPDDKDVVVDAKVSLVAYEQALSPKPTRRARRSLQAAPGEPAGTRQKRLSEQDYDQLEDVRSLDFVLLFVPIESAFTLAMEQDHGCSPKLSTSAS